LLSAELLKQRGIKITGILFNGDSNPETEKVILNYTGLTCIGKIPKLDQSLQSFVREQASGINI
jgi:dethiobiotin synthetase